MLTRYRALSRQDRKHLRQALWRLLVARFALLFGIARAEQLLKGRPRRWLEKTQNPDLDIWQARQKALARAESRIPGVHCLARSLALRWWMRSRGLAAELRIGVRTENGQSQSHAWVEYNGQNLGETAESLAGFSEIWNRANKQRPTPR